MERFGFKDGDLSTPEHDELLLWVLNKDNVLHMLLSLGSKITPNWYNQITWHRRWHRRCDNVPCNWQWSDECCTGVCEEDKEKRAKRLKTLALALMQAHRFRDNKAQYEERLEIVAEEPILGYNHYNIGFADAKILVNLRGFTFGEENEGQACYFSKESIFSSLVGYEIDEEDHSHGRVVSYYVEIKPNVRSIGELVRQINLYKSHLENSTWLVVTKTNGLKDILGSQKILVFEWQTKNPQKPS